jgi:hypothetical protein
MIESKVFVENGCKNFKTFVVKITCFVRNITKTNRVSLSTSTIENAGAMQQWDIYIVAESEQNPPLPTLSISKRHEH